MATNVTITQVADIAQNLLADAAGATWAPATVEEWVVLALRDYAKHFLRQRADTITCTTDARGYVLPEDFQDILNVQYPYLAADPYRPNTDLVRRDRRHPNFWTEAGYYDILIARSGDSENCVLYISQKPTTGEYINVVYSGLYYDINASSPAVTYIYVPDQHIPILTQFVQWKAATERLAAEIADPDRTIHLIDDLTKAADAMEQQYRRAIKDAKGGRSEGLITPPWRVDQHDPIY